MVITVMVTISGHKETIKSSQRLTTIILIKRAI